MESSQPQHWDRSFEKVFAIVLAFIGLFLLSLFFGPILSIVVVGSMIAIPVLIIRAIWRFFFAK
jgi:uncharacterized paraquat-inducible protein A